MRTTIKAIKCPQCKSTKNTFLGEDKYQCSYCDAEFILDNDDVNIFINKRHESSANIPPISKVIIPIIGFLFTVGVIIVILAFANSKKNNYSRIGAITNEETFVAMPNTMNIISGRETVKPLYIVAKRQINRRNQAPSPDQVFVYDIMQQKLLKKIPVDSRTKLSIKAFSDTTIYLISDIRAIYQLNPVSLELVNITNTLKTTYSQLSSGVSSIDFSPEAKALTIITNEGKTYTIFPDKQEIYTTTELAELRQDSRSQPETAGYNVEAILYIDDSGVLVNHKDSSGVGFITEYIDSSIQESTWRINSENRVEQAKPYQGGFILMLMNNSSQQLTIIQENGEYKQIQLS